MGVGFSHDELADVARGEALGEVVLLGLPRTYMNRSGEAARELVGRHGADPADVIVVYDDVALPLGRIRLRARGSSGSHKGMQSVIAHLGTREIPRLRLGIGGAGERPELADYVLDEFDADERPVVERMLERGVEALLVVLNEGLARAASRFNRMEAPSPGDPS